MKNNKGITVLELIIVLSIIALIFIITLPNMATKKEKINIKECDKLIELVNGQSKLYEMDNDKKPVTINQMIDEGYIKKAQTLCPNGEVIELAFGEAVIIEE